MGLIVSVYKDPLGDCTNNGMSKGVLSLCILNADGPSSPAFDQPAAMLVKGNMPGMVKIVPAILDDQQRYSPDPRWVMMGGNYASTSDSRFHAAVSRITGSPSYGAVPIHDRIES